MLSNNMATVQLAEKSLRHSQARTPKSGIEKCCELKNEVVIGLVIKTIRTTVVNRHSRTAKTRVRFQVRTYVICGGQSEWGSFIKGT